jgi:ABC-type polysaccharide/polyol phosphate transport system ATPase subunit
VIAPAAPVTPYVRFDGVWKSFARGARHDSLRDLLPAALRLLTGRRPMNADVFWALQDLSFEVRPGHALGIVGANGAGKSTVLKLISRIMRPTRGTVDVRGRVGALIEVAAGFHPDLSGRENVFLKGAIMGMTRRDIARRFDDIVSFAGVESFIDASVKHYSSGMTARLGFAVASSFEPDILLIDEALTVGDRAFQRRAYARLEELLQRQLPIVFVSHELERVLQLCDEALLLDHGRVLVRGTPAECIAHYTEGEIPAYGDEAPSPVELSAVTTCDEGVLYSGGELRLRISGCIHDAVAARNAGIGVRLRALPGEDVVFTTDHRRYGLPLPSSGPFELEIVLQLNVGPGVYRAQPVVWGGDALEWTRGRGMLITVERRQHAWGAAYLNPRMRWLQS